MELIFSYDCTVRQNHRLFFFRAEIPISAVFDMIYIINLKANHNSIMQLSSSKNVAANVAEIKIKDIILILKAVHRLLT
jgi:hypothetical protein